jgi:predicted SAM-dependent methyltransferase
MINIKKKYLEFPSTLRKLSRIQKLQRALIGGFLSPTYWMLAHPYHAPGLKFRTLCSRLAVYLLVHSRKNISLVDIYHLMFWPMDSTRYFEFDFVWRVLSQMPINRYLDVSSPRLIPLILLNQRKEITGDLINPDSKDLSVTSNYIAALGLADRCFMHDCFIESVRFEAESFDIITSISVIEHIPDDIKAIQKMWELLKSGGKLLLTVPCAAEASEQYINHDFYGLPVPKNNSGYFFSQRFYDQSLVEDRIYKTIGEPVHFSVYGEKHAGFFRRNVEEKWSNPNYPYWQEPYIMAREYRYFSKIADLSGEGVIGMEFIKK